MSTELKANTTNAYESATATTSIPTKSPHDERKNSNHDQRMQSQQQQQQQQQQQRQRFIGKYLISSEIGKGSFATVYKAYKINDNSGGNLHTSSISTSTSTSTSTSSSTSISTNNNIIDNNSSITNSKSSIPVAIKSVNRSKLKSKKLLENLEIEIQILKTMKHPHIVKLLDYKQTGTHFHLVMDYCSMGDLSYFIRRRTQLVKTHPIICSLIERYPSPEGSHGLNETLVLHFLRQLSSALKFLRDKSLVHRDIKPQNLLLCPPVRSRDEFVRNQFEGMWELPILKIADFGFARFLPSTSMAETLCGSPLYMAPEILRYEKYNAKADLWSVGAVLYEMTVGKPPFKANNHIELLKNIEKANDKIKFPSAAQVPDALKQLVRSLLKYNPTERISFQEFFNDNLIICDLEDTNKPLETSEIDENLFISEYISPIKKSERSRLIQPMTAINSSEPREEMRMNRLSGQEQEQEQEQEQ
ncbi:protein kinase, partial [Acetobacter pasteurianus]|nr:protein kinase [Acetobacter pasteurianus]